MKTTPIQSAWEIFEHRSVPADATPAQRREFRRTFFAGMHTMFWLQAQLANVDAQHAGAVRDSLAAEINEFAAAPY
jgi:hypothetical protein